MSTTLFGRDVPAALEPAPVVEGESARRWAPCSAHGARVYWSLRPRWIAPPRCGFRPARHGRCRRAAG